MPKRSKHPKLRASIKRGKAGQVWRSWWYDNRGTGKPDVPLGTDYQAALQKWAEIHFDRPMIAGTIEEAFRAFEQHGMSHRLDGQPRKPETIAGYTKCLRAIRGPFGRARWSEITMQGLRAYIKARDAKGRAKQEMQLLSVIWNWARAEGLTDLPFPAAGMQRSTWKGSTNARTVEVGDQAFEAIYKHADQTLRDALDIATATGLRVTDVLALRISDVRNGELVNEDSSKTGKRGEYDLSASTVLQPLIDRRLALRGTEHVYILANYKRPKGKITYRALVERFNVARAAAAKDLPECAGLWLRDMRKRAAALAPSLAEASKLLQHSSLSTTSKHYRRGDKLKPVR